MNAELGILVMTAFSVGFLHTLLGPDHYVPFIAMSRTNRWSARKTCSITALCGLGHVMGSVVIGSIGLMLGTILMQVEALEAFRGDAAAWLLIGFGLAYLDLGHGSRRSRYSPYPSAFACRRHGALAFASA